MKLNELAKRLVDSLYWGRKTVKVSIVARDDHGAVVHRRTADISYVRDQEVPYVEICVEESQLVQGP